MAFRYSECKGYTILEVIVAIAISAIVTSLSFYFMKNVTTNTFYLRTRDNNVSLMLLTKKRIENTFYKIQSVVTSGNTQVFFTEYNSDTIHALVLKDDSLLKDDVPLCGNIKELKFAIDSTDTHKCVFLWECTLYKDSWIGGAIDLPER